MTEKLAQNIRTVPGIAELHSAGAISPACVFLLFHEEIKFLTESTVQHVQTVPGIAEFHSAGAIFPACVFLLFREEIKF
jgi:hypothetical protein